MASHMDSLQEMPADGRQTFWYQHSSSSLESLLRRTGSYTDEQKISHLKFLKEVVIPTLGPAPPISNPIHLLTHSFSPIEPSINFSDAGKPCVRFSFEPLGAMGGTRSDPFAQDAVKAILPSLVRATKADLRWFEIFMKAYFLTKEETEVAESKLPLHVTRLPQCFFAVDLNAGERVLKAYLFPILKHLATGETTEKLTFDVVRGLEAGGKDFKSGLALIEEYLVSVQEPASLEMVSVDCVGPTDGARVKLYIRTKSNAFKIVRDVYTLGGRKADTTTLEGLGILREIWPLLLDQPEGSLDDDWSKPVNDPKSQHGGVAFGLEMAAGQSVPDVKVYVPMWQYARSDLVLIENYEKIFKKHGWEWADGGYRTAIYDAFGGDIGETQARIHTYSSFLYSQRNGVYMTTYVAPPVSKGC